MTSLDHNAVLAPYTWAPFLGDFCCYQEHLQWVTGSGFSRQQQCSRGCSGHSVPHPDGHVTPFPWWPQAVRLGSCLEECTEWSAGSDRASKSHMLKIAPREARRCKKGHFGDGERANWLMGWRVPC